MWAYLFLWMAQKMLQICCLNSYTSNFSQLVIVYNSITFSYTGNITPSIGILQAEDPPYFELFQHTQITAWFIYRHYIWAESMLNAKRCFDHFINDLHRFVFHSNGLHFNFRPMFTSMCVVKVCYLLEE